MPRALIHGLVWGSVALCSAAAQAGPLVLEDVIVQTEYGDRVVRLRFRNNAGHGAVTASTDVGVAPRVSRRGATRREPLQQLGIGQPARDSRPEKPADLVQKMR